MWERRYSFGRGKIREGCINKAGSSGRARNYSYVRCRLLHEVPTSTQLKTIIQIRDIKGEEKPIQEQIRCLLGRIFCLIDINITYLNCYEKNIVKRCERWANRSEFLREIFWCWSIYVRSSNRLFEIFLLKCLKVLCWKKSLKMTSQLQ